MEIPTTLPTSRIWEKIQSIASQWGDDERIKAAVLTPRSRTKEKGRAKGLPDMLEYVLEQKLGRFIVMSGKGMCVFRHHGGKKEDLKTESFLLKNDIRGTLISWEVELSP